MWFLVTVCLPSIIWSSVIARVQRKSVWLLAIQAGCTYHIYFHELHSQALSFVLQCAVKQAKKVNMLDRPRLLKHWKAPSTDKSLTSGQTFWIVIYQVDYIIHLLNNWQGNFFLYKRAVSVYRLSVCKFGCWGCSAKT